MHNLRKNTFYRQCFIVGIGIGINLRNGIILLIIFILGKFSNLTILANKLGTNYLLESSENQQITRISAVNALEITLTNSSYQTNYIKDINKYKRVHQQCQYCC